VGQDPKTRRGRSESSVTPPRFTVKVLAEWAEGRLTADGWIQERPCRVTIDTGASVTVARPDIVAGLPERELSRLYVLQTASGETIPVVKEAHVVLTLGRHTLRSWVFVADIMDDFILGLDILRAYDASVDIGRRVLRLGRDEVTGGDRVWPYRPARDRKVAKASLGSTAWSTGSSATLEQR
jgi:hypothetical protein